MVEGGGGDADEKFGGLGGGLRDGVEGERVVDLAGLAGDVGDGDLFGHGDSLDGGVDDEQAEFSQHWQDTSRYHLSLLNK